MKRILTVWMAALILMASFLMAATGTEKDHKRKEKKQVEKIVRISGTDIHIDLSKLRGDLKKLTEEELRSVRKALADLPKTLETVEIELKDLPARLKEVEKELQSLPAKIKEMEKELAGLPETMKRVEKELAQVRDLDIDKIVDEALESLKDLDKRIEAAIEREVAKEEKAG